MSQPQTVVVGSEVATKIASDEKQPKTAFEQQWTVGRAPWYDPSSSNNRRPFMIGVTGGTASGKTTVCDAIVKKLGLPWVVLLSMDRFYLSLAGDELEHAADHNFDHPNAFDWPLLEQTIHDLGTAKSVQVPRYSFKTHQRETETDTLYGADVIIVEGILILHNKTIRDQFDMRIYVDEEDDVRLARRVKRDIAERGRQVEDVLYQYLHTVKPAFDQFIRPTKRYADLIIPHGGENYVAIDLMVEHIRHQLTKRGVVFRQAVTHIGEKSTSLDYDGVLSGLKENEKNNTSTSTASTPATKPTSSLPTTTSAPKSTTSASSKPTSTATIPLSKSMEIMSLNHPELSANINRLPSNVVILPRTQALTAIHTHLRDASTSQDDFQFHVHRVARLLLSKGLDELTAQQHTIMTPTNAPFHGIQLLSQICGVSIVRSGEALEAALRELSPDVAIGKIVINQSKSKQDGPRLYYCKFPPDVANRKVLLLDGLCATGNAANMAVHVLLDHGVKEENIIFLSIIAAPEGVRHLLTSFPNIRVITSWMEDGLDSLHFLSPGLGAFGNRYFGTVGTNGIDH